MLFYSLTANFPMKSSACRKEETVMVNLSPGFLNSVDTLDFFVTTPEIEWISLNLNHINMSRQTEFNVIKTKMQNVGVNALGKFLWTG
jgi:hypothetical protein